MAPIVPLCSSRQVLQMLGMWMTACVLDRGMDLEMWCAEADRGFALWNLRHAHATCRHGHVPIRRCSHLIAWGLIHLWSCTRFNSKLLFYALLLAAPVYYSTRIPNIWSGSNLVSFIETFDTIRVQIPGIPVSL